MMQLDLLKKELQEALEDAKNSPESEREANDYDLGADEKSPGAFKTISEVSEALGVPQHVLRFWESRFPQIKPTKLRGGRRYYRPQDIDILTTIKNLLYKQGYTIKGAKKAFSQMQQPAARNVAPPPMPKPTPRLTERQVNQLSVVRQELIGMRDLLAERLA